MKNNAVRFSFKNHMAYNGWKYAVLVIGSIFGWSLVFAVTEYRPPPELTVSVYIIDGYMPTEQLDVLEEQTRPYLPGMEAIEFIAPTIANEYDEQQYLMVIMGSGQGNIFFVSEERMEEFAAQGVALPLDDYLSSGALDTRGLDISSGRRGTPLMDEDKNYMVDNNGQYLYDPGIPEQQFAIPLGELYGFITQNQYDCRNMYAIVTSYCVNPDDSIRMLQAFIDEKLEPRPDWLDELEQQEREAVEE